jgi:hypothetical protein
MARLGFIYPIPDMGSAPGLNTVTDFALGSGHPATYGVTPESVVTTPPSYPEADQPRYQLALAGSLSAMATMAFPGGGSVSYQTGGCRGSARKQLYGSVDAYETSVFLPQIQENLFSNYLGSDKAYQSALRTWQACMGADKFSVANPDAAANSLLQIAGKTSAVELMRQQAALAAADVACDGQSHLRQRTGQALEGFVGLLSPQMLTQLDNVARTRAQADHMAHQIVSP